MASTLTWLVHSIADLLCPPAKRPVYQAAEGCFSREELDAIRKEHCCHVLSKYTSTLDDAHFLEWAGLLGASPALTQGLCQAVRCQAGDSGGGGAGGAPQITLEGVIIAKSLSEKMDSHTAQDFALDVLDVERSGRVSRAHLQAVIQGCMQLAMPEQQQQQQHNDTAFAVEAAAIAAGACAMSDGDGRSDHLTRDGYAKLCKVSPALNSALTSLLSNIGASASNPNASPCAPAAAPAPAAASEPASADGSTQQLLTEQEGSGAGSSSQSQAGGTTSSSKQKTSRSGRAAALSEAAAGPGPGSAAIAAALAAAKGPGRMLLPQLGWGLVSPAEGLLQPGWVWLLAAGLAPVQRMEWRLLYNSQKHGISFSNLMARLGEATPTLLLIRDKGGALFGGIAHSPWKKTGSFYGDFACCIFSLLPTARMYPASGINANLQWCGIGFTQLPNGLGFGGQVGHYGLYIDSTMDGGMSRPSATFASPSLSYTETFQVDAVEAWHLVPPQDEATRQGGGTSSSSALCKAKEDLQILEWAGVRKNYSAALKDEPIED